MQSSQQEYHNVLVLSGLIKDHFSQNIFHLRLQIMVLEGYIHITLMRTESKAQHLLTQIKTEEIDWRHSWVILLMLMLEEQQYFQL